jgi:hypothetical protein
MRTLVAGIVCEISFAALTVHSWHVHVEQRDVGLGRPRHYNRFMPIRGFRHDLNIGDGFEQKSQALPEKTLVVGDQEFKRQEKTILRWNWTLKPPRSFDARQDGFL